MKDMGQEDGARWIRIVLPWPTRTLHPNARPHWAVKARATTHARSLARSAMAEAVEAHGAVWSAAGAIAVRWTFCPPDRRRRDDDGLAASCKAYRDGMADAMGVDDHRFRASYETAKPVKGGKVVVDVAKFALGGAVEREEGVAQCMEALPEWLRS